MGTFNSLLDDTLRNCPDRTAITLLFSDRPDEVYNYQDLMGLAGRYAELLEKAGVEQDEVVIIILDHGSALLGAFWGAVLHGAIPSIMPFLTEKLSPEQYRKSLRALFEVTAPGAVFTEQAFVPEVERAAADADWGDRTQPKILAPVTLGGSGKRELSSYGGNSRKPEDIVLLQHSSGTTGLQKGVALSHQAVFNQVSSYASTLSLDEKDVVVSWLPLYHDMGLIAGFVMPVLARIPLVLMSPFDWVRAPYRLPQAVSRFRGTLTWLPNFAYNFCAKKIRDRDLEGVDLSSWRAVINCSEPMHWQSHQMFLERFRPYGFQETALATCYAMAENVFAVTQGGIDAPVKVDLIDRDAFHERQEALSLEAVQELVAGSEVERDTSIRMLSAGKCIPNTAVKVIDRDGEEVAARQIGQIAIKSDCMLTEYYNRPGVTRDAFLDGWYLTGDLGYVVDGDLYVTGRIKDLIIVGGKNIYPQDLERLVEGVDGVHPGRVVAFGVYNEGTGTEDVVVLAEMDTLREHVDGREDGQQKAALETAIRKAVTKGSDVALRYAHAVERNWLLKTSSGKIARSANRERYLKEMAGKRI